MKKLIFTILILSVLSGISYSWDPEAAKFFPIATGNSWTYTKKIYAPPLGCMSPTSSYNFKISITGDSILNGHRYYKFSSGNLLRLDSNSMNVYKWMGGTECLTDSLLARKNDWVNSCQAHIQVVDTNIVVFAMQKRQTKAVAYPGYTRRIMYGIGLYYDGGCEVTSGTVDELNGCVISGMLIGDTTVTAPSYENMKYLPLSIGNVWVYKTYKSAPGWICYAYEKYIITGTSQINNKTYYIVNNVTNLFNPICSVWGFPVASRLFLNSFIRIDSINANIYGSDSCLVDSLAANEGDTSRVCAFYYSPVVCDTSTQIIFGYTKPAKNFLWNNIEASEIMWYIKDFGFVRFHRSQPGPSSADMLLKGCVINGVVYGDTNSMVGINHISTEIPEKFSLSQNYPNPFNPSTKIKFAVPPSPRGEGLGVRLIIYDALGREVQTLVNEALLPGTYEVDFPAPAGDGSNFSSGVYYYTLSSGNYFETKRMVLIK